MRTPPINERTRRAALTDIQREALEYFWEHGSAPLDYQALAPMFPPATIQALLSRELLEAWKGRLAISPAGCERIGRPPALDRIRDRLPEPLRSFLPTAYELDGTDEPEEVETIDPWNPTTRDDKWVALEDLLEALDWPAIHVLEEWTRHGPELGGKLRELVDARLRPTPIAAAPKVDEKLEALDKLPEELEKAVLAIAPDGDPGGYMLESARLEEDRFRYWFHSVDCPARELDEERRPRPCECPRTRLGDLTMSTGAFEPYEEAEAPRPHPWSPSERPDDEVLLEMDREPNRRGHSPEELLEALRALHSGRLTIRAPLSTVAPVLTSSPELLLRIAEHPGPMTVTRTALGGLAVKLGLSSSVADYWLRLPAELVARELAHLLETHVGREKAATFRCGPGGDRLRAVLSPTYAALDDHPLLCRLVGAWSGFRLLRARITERLSVVDFALEGPREVAGRRLWFGYRFKNSEVGTSSTYLQAIARDVETGATLVLPRGLVGTPYVRRHVGEASYDAIARALVEHVARADKRREIALAALELAHEERVGRDVPEWIAHYLTTRFRQKAAVVKAARARAVLEKPVDRLSACLSIAFGAKIVPGRWSTLSETRLEELAGRLLIWPRE